jgi:glycosyltransferase involved in cell wall biosynthesis
VSGLFPTINPAGHVIETAMVNELRRWFDLRSVGTLPIRANRLHGPLTNTPGLEHDVILRVCRPQLWRRYHAWWRLLKAIRRWNAQGWNPDLILVYGLSPVYNAIVRELRGRPGRPRMVLNLADSAQLGVSLPPVRRFRYQLKPMVWLDEEMLPWFDACIATSAATEPRFRALGMPWHWIPNGCDARRAIRPSTGPTAGPVTFGYFGSLAEYAGAPGLLRVFTSRPRAARLLLCGFGKQGAHLREQFGAKPGVEFHEPRTPDDCLRWAQQCDVLVNARPVYPGNENNFPSKIFEYALSGRPILTTSLSGADQVLGSDAFYVDHGNLETELDRALEALARLPRAELNRRGAAIQSRLLMEFPWTKQGERLAEFLKTLIAEKTGK